MTDSIARHKKHILIVEDHPLFSAMLAHLINNEPGLAVSGEANNMTDAFAIIKDKHPDAAVVDITLCGASGMELLKMLNAKRIALPVLVVSMHSERLYAQRVIRAGAKGYISKLASPEEVIKAIHKVVKGHVYVSEYVNDSILSGLGIQGYSSPLFDVESLSDRELEVFQLIGNGLNSRQISEQLNLSHSTIDSYRARIKEKLDINNAAELYQRAAQWLIESNCSE